ncbi:hypothetical protein NONS58_03870 [Nitrosococcus oceani]|nr:hypothetical protein NONS58_03870 [Nitrosococcus oceani]
MKSESNNTFEYANTDSPEHSKSHAPKKRKASESPLNSLFLVFYIMLILILISLA